MRPFSLLIKPAGPDCNLACSHCFYSDKSAMFGGKTHRMADSTLEKLVRDYLSLNFSPSAFCWQGGEPTLMGLEFFHRVVALEKKYTASGQAVTNALQTNATLLDDSWCKFLRDNKFLVGISLEGPVKYHDRYRKNAAGVGSFEHVMAAMELLKKHRVEFNVLTLLTDSNVDAPQEIFEFLVAQQITYMQFIPCFEKQDGQLASYSITPQQYGRFLCRLLDIWIANGPQKVSIRLFDSVLSHLFSSNHTLCTFGRKCNDYVVVEHNGDVFACDFFVEPQWRLGNMLETPIGELANSQTKRLFADKKSVVNNGCIVCRHFAVCRGGCIKERVFERNDYSDQSYFCRSYKMFFDYALPKLMGVLPAVSKRMIK